MKTSLCAYLMSERDKIGRATGLHWRGSEIQVVPPAAPSSERAALSRAVQYGRMMALDDALTEALAGRIRVDEREMLAAGGVWARVAWRAGAVASAVLLIVAAYQDLTATDAMASSRAREMVMEWADMGRTSISTLACDRPDDAGGVACTANLSNGDRVALKCHTRYLLLPPRCVRDTSRP